MATDKLFKVFGVSKHPEQGYKVRFANDMLRSKVLTKSGHTDIELVELSEAVSKYEGIKLIQNLPEFSNANAQNAIMEYLEDKAPKAPAKSKPVAKGVMKAKAPAKAKAPTADMDENIPF
jgi:hypothetical protein